MSARQTATPQEARWIGAGVTLVGLYFMSIGFGLLPVPGGPRNLHAPLWIVFLAGLTFFLGGVAVLVQVIGRANDSGELPAGAPYWIRVVQHLIGIAIFASFAMVGSWIALAGEGRQFSGNALVFSASINEIVARSAFGFGAIICWLCTIAFAVSGARKLRRGSIQTPD